MRVRAYIGAFKRVLSEHDLTPLEDALANFRRDRTPEREIQVWERIARSYSAELSVRPQASERHLLYRVIFARSLAADIGLFVLALSIEGRTELDSIRAVLPMPLKVIRLTVSLETIQERLSSDTTTGRQVDLHWAGVWLNEGRGVGLEDFEVPNDRPIRDVATDVLDRLGWA